MRIRTSLSVPIAAYALLVFAVQPGTPARASTPTPILLSGNIMFDDGMPPNVNIRIERVCATGTPRLEAHTDAKGHFSFQLGQSSAVDADAQDGKTPGLSTSGAGPLSSQPGSAATSPDQLSHCELIAVYPGYRSDRVELAGRKPLDDPDLGTIVLHRSINVLGSTLTVTTALAPRAAQKAYMRGLRLATKGEFATAETHFRTAVQLYPRFAIAWYALGDLQQRQGRDDDARKSYEHSIAADDKFVSPYGQLAVLSLLNGQWQAAADYTRHIIQLNPIEFPGAFYFNALANFKLNKLYDAERSAKQLLQIDAQHRYPEGESLLGELLLKKGNYAEATAHLRAYLALRPHAYDATRIKQMLTEAEQAGAEAKKQDALTER